MTTVTQVQNDHQSPSLMNPQEMSSTTPPSANQEGDLQDEAIRIAALTRQALAALDSNLPGFNPSQALTADEIIALPLAAHRVDDELHDLPRRRSPRAALAQLIAPLLYPVHEGSLTAIIRYEADRVRVRGWAVLQRKFDLLRATQRNGRAALGMSGGAGPGVQSPVWSSRIVNQGPWDEARTPVSRDGVPAIPMPVKVAQEKQLAPFFAHLRGQGTHVLVDGNGLDGMQLDGGKGEPYYGVQGAEFKKGVLYEDGRMDLCKMVVGPDHIWRLMDSLRDNDFVRHFLLGNNIIGPSGAKAIATFINELPERMETWYLAGNCIDGDSFTGIVDAMVKSPAITNVWLKRNPLGRQSAGDIFRLITQTPNLRTLDLDQTELGDAGVADLFTRLAEYVGPEGSKLPLRNLYMNGNGISVDAARAIARFLTSPHCALSSLYMSCNPLGDDGATALAQALPAAPHLARLLLQSVGVSTQGAAALCRAVRSSAGVRTFDIGQAFATEDLAQAYNYVDDGAVPAIKDMLAHGRLEYFNLGHCPISHAALAEISAAIADAAASSSSLLYYAASSILRRPTGSASFVPSRDTPLPHPDAPPRADIEAEKLLRARLEANVRARFPDDTGEKGGPGMTYVRFLAEEKRWLVSDKEDVRKIDSVYRNRDAGMARRGLVTLVKDWEEGDTTLQRVGNAQAPV
ncbi:putative 26s proteasome non-atpase regulatory subunit 3 protein [Purpureocillium lavendulum]|uniref:26s proteasome non-atpase regulatory subunit 3 protein n=1 Tax=Purpureocillium lavendulum TaxID=1247861 RepID=A0AB34FRT8_9HYPO|nr:putative 26s proteasome non-atpase regulatory subunit 3 protein [Purpureocillium lavendulum]